MGDLDLDAILTEIRTLRSQLEASEARATAAEQNAEEQTRAAHRSNMATAQERDRALVAARVLIDGVRAIKCATLPRGIAGDLLQHPDVVAVKSTLATTAAPAVPPEPSQVATPERAFDEIFAIVKLHGTGSDYSRQLADVEIHDMKTSPVGPFKTLMAPGLVVHRYERRNDWALDIRVGKTADLAPLMAAVWADACRVKAAAEGGK